MCVKDTGTKYQLWIRGSNGQDTDKAVRVLLLGDSAFNGSWAGFGAAVGFFTTVKLD